MNLSVTITMVETNQEGVSSFLHKAKIPPAKQNETTNFGVIKLVYNLLTSYSEYE